MKTIKTLIYSAAIASFILAAGTLLLYGYTFGWTLSSFANDWGVFGSLLGGCFTLIGAIITTLTFILLRDQQQLTAKALQKQIDSTTFDQYRQHRAAFNDLVNLSTCSGCFSVPEPKNLYKKIFPENSPIEITLRVNLVSENGNPSALGGIITNLEKIYKILDGQLQQTPGQNLATLMHQIIYTLELKHSQHFSPHGKITSEETNSIVYLDQLETQLNKIDELITEVSFFGGLDYRIKKTKSATWHTHIFNYLELIIEKDLYKSILHNNSRGAIGLIKLSQASTSEPLSILKIATDKILYSKNFLSTLQLDYSKKNRTRFCK